MKKIKIVTDSHSGINSEEALRLNVEVIPMPFYIEDKTYYEGKDIKADDFFDKLRKGVNVSTSQPSPQILIDTFDKILKDYDQIIYIPISSGLSGSYNGAVSISKTEQFEGKVFVVDNGRVATPQHRSIIDAVELLDEGFDAEKICEILEKNRGNMGIYVAVDRMDYLRKGGRVSATTSFLANALNIKPILYFDTGLLSAVKKCHGMKKARHEMILAIKNDLETRFNDWYKKGEVYLMAASSATKEVTEDWVREIKEAFPDMEVLCDPLAMGVSCHIGPDGLGIACACRPER